jgi:hypothetical protein
MKKIAWLLVAVFCSAMLLFAGDDDKKGSNQMVGWICNASCVDRSSGKPTCDASCSQSTPGEMVFIDESTGQVSRIANQEKAQPMSGKKCKMTATRNPDNMFEIQDLSLYGGGG